MKTRNVAFALALLILTSVAGAQVRPCHEVSWSPELFTFYGDVDTVVSKLANANGNLDTRRVFAFVVESSNGTSHLGLFERTGSGEMTLGTVSKSSFGSLVNNLSNDLLNNTGKRCAGELTREMLDDHDLLNGVEYATLAKAPNNLTQAFKALGLGGDDYVRVTIALLC